MFTGIVEEVGRILQIDRGSRSSILHIGGKLIFDDLKIGDSVAVNGVCLTVTALSPGSFTADVMSETLSRSSLGALSRNSPVNLERAMAADGRFGGHIVSGHIDGTGTIESIKKDDNAVWYTIKASQKLMHYIVEKGSIAIDGISLTVARVTKDTFSVSIIPHTINATILGTKGIGDVVNLENDVVGKYIERFLTDLPVETETAETKGIPQKSAGQNQGITKEFLAKYGY